MYTHTLTSSIELGIDFKALVAQSNLYDTPTAVILYNNPDNGLGFMYSQTKVESQLYHSHYIPTTLIPLPHYHSNIYPLINDVENTPPTKNSETSIRYAVSDDLGCVKTAPIYTNFPLFQSASHIIKIPSKVEYALRRLVSKKALKQIHPNLEVAIELCLLFLSQLSSTYFTWKDGSNTDGWKSLKAAYLRKLLDYQPDTYKKIREVLETPFMTGPIIECDYIELKGEKCFHYRLSNTYIGKGIKEYQLKTKLVQDLRLNYHFERVKETQNHPICKNLHELYPRITLPTVEEIEC